MIPLRLRGQSSLGPYSLLTLDWPEPHPLPGQHLRLEGGTRLWPMRSASPDRLEVLGCARGPLPAEGRACIEGLPLPIPEGELVLLAQGLGLAPLIQLCAARARRGQTLALLELPDPPPFRPRPSRFWIGGMPAGVIAAIPLLEDLGLPSRLASRAGLPGTFEGGVEALFAALPRTDAGKIAMGDKAFLDRARAIIPGLGPTLCVE